MHNKAAKKALLGNSREQQGFKKGTFRGAIGSNKASKKPLIFQLPGVTKGFF